MDIQELLKRETRVNLEQWCTRAAQAVYVGDERVLARVLGKYLLYVHGSDLSLAPHLMLDGYWEIWVTMAIANYIQPGMRCIDVGANVGYYSVLLADWVGSAGYVHAVEADPFNAARLRLNLKKVDNATVIEAAAWDEAGEAPLFMQDVHEGDHTLRGDVEERFKERGLLGTRSVKTVRLESVVEAPVDFIKLDIEGAERRAWVGMREILHNSPRVQIAAEWNRKYDPDYELLALAKEDGFKAFDIGGDGKLKPLQTTELADASIDLKMLWFKR